MKKLKGKSGAAASGSKKYVFADLLTFMEKTVEDRQTEDSFETENVSQDTTGQDSDNESEQQEVDVVSLESSSSTTPQPTNTRKRKKVNLEEKMIQFLDKCQPTDDADRDLFRSLLPSVRT